MGRVGTATAMWRRLLLVAAAVLAATVIGGDARAGPGSRPGPKPAATDNRSFCFEYHKDYRRKIGACTRLIQSRQLSKEDTVRALLDRAHARHMIGDNKGRVRDLTEVIGLDASNADAYASRAGAHVDAKRYEEAIIDYDAALRFKPKAIVFFLRAGVWSRLGDQDRAIADLTDAIGLAPDWEYYRDRAQAYEKKGELAKAVVDYRVAREKTASERYHQSVFFAKISEIERRLGEASVQASAAPAPPHTVAVPPAGTDDRSVCLELRGAASVANLIAPCSRLLETGNLSREDKVKALERRVEARLERFLERRYPDLRTLDVTTIAARARPGFFADEGQMADLAEAIRLDPGNFSPYLSRAILRLLNREDDRALADLQKVIELKPSEDSFVLRSLVWHLRGDHDRAIAEVDQALASARAAGTEPYAGNTYHMRALAREKKGELAAALDDYRHAIRTHGHIAEAQAGIKRVETRLAAAGPSSVGERPAEPTPRVAQAPAPAAKAAPATAPATDSAVAHKPVPATPPAAAAALPEVSPVAPAPPVLARTPAVPTAIAPGSRVALVIGNGAYTGLRALPNPANDARDLAATLTRLDFEVTLAIDADRHAMEDKLATFAKAARRAEVAVAFFAGHGLQYQGINYLAPVDAKLDDETDLRRRFIKVQDLTEDMQRASGVRLLILDACRDNDAVRQLSALLPPSRSGAVRGGLAKEEARGLLIAYATQADRVATDGTGRNSPFTAALLKHIVTPGLDVRVALARVRRDVLVATGGEQLPELADSMIGEFAFR